MLLNLIFTLYSNGLKTELCDNVVTSLSNLSTSVSSVAISQYVVFITRTLFEGFFRIATQTRLRFSEVEVSATITLRSSSGTGSPLRPIHISNDSGFICYYVVNVFFPLSPVGLLTDLRRLSCDKQLLLIIRKIWVQPRFLFVGSVLFIYVVFVCAVFWFGLRSVSYA